MISITLQFTDIAAAAHALARMNTPEQFATAVSATIEQIAPAPAPTVIAHADRPDVGAPEAPAMPPTPPADPAVAAFGGAVVQAAPLVAPPAAPLIPPPAAPSAPSAATAPTAVPAVERDSTGLPWDSRIHASTKTKTAAGVWTVKRNVDAALKAQIEADLRGLPAPATPPVAPPQAPAAASPKTFPQYMAEIGEAFASRPLDAHNAMTAALATVQLANVSQLAGNPQLIPAVDAEFRRVLG